MQVLLRSIEINRIKKITIPTYLYKKQEKTFLTVEEPNEAAIFKIRQ